jgi:hypothetical protein
MSKEHILNELEKFHQGKLDEVRAKRAGHAKPNQAQEIVANGTVNIAIDPRQRKVVLTWDK